MLELVAAIVTGSALGVLTGLLPGLHPNTLIPLLVGFATYTDPVTAAVALVTIGITNSFVAFIPAILLGAPEDAEAMSALPGHRLLLAGRGYEAIKLTVIGGLGGVLFCIAALPVLWFIFPLIYTAIRPLLHWILTAVVVYMVLTENEMKSIIWAAVTFALAGILGLVSLDNFGNMSLFPMLTGLFGIPMLLLSLKQGVRLPESMNYESERLSKSVQLNGIGAGSVAGVLVGLLPGIGAAQATVMAQEAVGRTRAKTLADRMFLISVGSVTAADAVYSLLALWLVGNPRSGISVAVQQLVSITTPLLCLFLATIVVAAGTAAYITLRLARGILPLLRRINYNRMNIFVIGMLVALIALFTGPLGLMIAAVATAIGLVPNLVGIRRSHAMGCLLLPTILFFAGF